MDMCESNHLFSQVLTDKIHILSLAIHWFGIYSTKTIIIINLGVGEYRWMSTATHLDLGE